MASLNGRTGWAPRTPGEAGDQLRRAVYLPPATQNRLAGLSNEPLPYPQMGRNPHLDALIQNRWANPSHSPPIVADQERRMGLPDCSPPFGRPPINP
jgi:hypothetical protein